MNEQLAYLFQADLPDGTTYFQGEDDVSLTDPKRSCYYDIKDKEPLRFRLVGKGHTYEVDLTDGHFSVDGIPFFMHEVADKNGDPMEVTNVVDLKGFRLVYFINNTRKHRADGTEISHVRVWRFGWQCKVKGKNYQQIMQIN